jgi:hypothetical protein
MDLGLRFMRIPARCAPLRLSVNSRQKLFAEGLLSAFMEAALTMSFFILCFFFNIFRICSLRSFKAL